MANLRLALVPKGKSGVERGDVPGWVMITLMTAALVVLLWTTVGPALTSLFEDAISRVTNIS
ncbi:hypothetical protein JTE88_06190 [Arcanobacterium phocisimile]|uniref:Uncharacterized protein n=1 Tax=Arcanobacterium phocisimile TaxID=1302235 RepID=A0ABX7IIW5_9ACTO|nr:hypothetical protein [Arcanobacterium phocisimile]QRV03052.1 hypothetical protein JTE88_06190 [Arcanobacterium phocisimile]